MSLHVRDRRAKLRALAAVALPFAAFVLQLAFWPIVRPFTWFLFYPAVFISSWIGGVRAGLVATLLSTVLALYFIPSGGDFRAAELRYFLTAGVFVGMGVLFSLFNGRLRRMNQEAAATNERLRQANDEVTRLYEKTKELDTLRSHFFAAVSHELRTPLALILGPTERLLAAKETSEAARRDLAVVARNAGTLLRHVNDLLDMAKLDAGRVALEYVEADVASHVRFVAGQFEVLSRENDIAFTVDAPAELSAHVDPDKLQRILQNLLGNAFKFTPRGGRIRVTLRATAERMRIEVADSGPGIPPDQREAVFEHFRQLEGGATRRFGGTGLGLSIARNLVALHGGVISAAEAPEGGALFAVELPRGAPRGAEVRPRAAAPAEASGSESEVRGAVEELRERELRPPAPAGAADGALVLVVEDNPEMSRFIAESLGDRYRVSVAFDGKEGLAKALELRPDLVLSDVMMPEMSGDELMHALRTHPELDATPIVMLTAKADDELRVKLLREGAQDHLTKPFAVEELRVRVENLIARKRAEDEILKLNERLHALASASMTVSAAVAGLPEASVDAVLHAIALQAQALTYAELVAVGLGTDPTRPFEPWVAIGISAERAAAIGPPPRPVGTLGLVSLQNEVIRVRDVRRHPAYEGLPPDHPELGSFLGVPIRFLGRSIGNIYLANKRGAAEFTDQDQQIVEMLAARAGVALETARLYREEGAARAWLESVIDQMSEGVVLMDARGRVAAHSRSILALSWGETGERDPFGNPIMLDLRYPSGQRLPVTEHPNVRALVREEAVIGAELLLRRRDGESVPVLVSAAPIRGRAGELTGATMIVQDISHFKELERLREEWASVIAHDMRQPIGVIVFSTDMLAKRREGGLQGEDAKLIERLRRAAMTLSRMIADMLDASRIEAKRLSIQRSDVDLPRLIEEVVERTLDLAERCEVHIEAGMKRIVSADPDRIGQVLSNLLSNAVKYGEPKIPIRIEVADHDGEAEVTITNRGRGIPADELPLLFSRFARSRETRTGGVPGIGLGLYICKGLIEAHEGRIWAESTPGGITSFHFTLPRAVREQAPPGPSAPPTDHAGAPLGR